MENRAGIRYYLFQWAQQETHQSGCPEPDGLPNMLRIDRGASPLKKKKRKGKEHKVFVYTVYLQVCTTVIKRDSPADKKEFFSFSQPE